MNEVWEIAPIMHNRLIKFPSYVTAYNKREAKLEKPKRKSKQKPKPKSKQKTKPKSKVKSKSKSKSKSRSKSKSQSGTNKIILGQTSVNDYEYDGSTSEESSDEHDKTEKYQIKTKKMDAEDKFNTIWKRISEFYAHFEWKYDEFFLKYWKSAFCQNKNAKAIDI